MTARIRIHQLPKTIKHLLKNNDLHRIKTNVQNRYFAQSKQDRRKDCVEHRNLDGEFVSCYENSDLS